MRMKAFLLALMMALVVPVSLWAKDDPFRSTPYPIPRFVSLNADEVNVRAGPGAKYPIKFVYRKRRQPVEVILEFDAWRKIRDREGDTGWVHGSLISGRRTGLVSGHEDIILKKKPKTSASPIVKLEDGVLVTLKECRELWCLLEIGDYKGWLQRKMIWGIYEGENFD